MGQILNRLIRIAKTNLAPEKDSYQTIVNNEDDELKRIIDELNKPKQEHKSNQRNTNYQQKNNSESSAKQNKQMDWDTACQVLNITKDSSIDEIKAAYKNKIKEYHPDKVSSLGVELKQLAAQKTLEINSAYEFIKKLKNF